MAKDCRTCRWFDRRGEKRVSINAVYRCTAPLPAMPPMPESIVRWVPRAVTEDHRSMVSFDAGAFCPAHEKAPKP